MRLRGWWLLVLVVGLVGARVGLWAAGVGSEVAGSRRVDTSGWLRSLAYRIPDDRVLVFDLPPGAQTLRLFTHAELESAAAAEAAEALRYSLTLEFAGRVGGQERLTYHFRSRQTTPAAEDGERSRSRYLRSDQPLLDVRGTVLSVADLGFRVGQVRLSVDSLDPGLTGVAVRLYDREVLAATRRHAQWPRLSVEDRRRLAVGNLYPQELLSEPERQALVRQSWSPIAPAGVEGADYDRRIVLMNEEALPKLIEEAPRGEALPPGVVGIVRVDEGQAVELEVRALGGDLTGLVARALPSRGSEVALMPARTGPNGARLTYGGAPGWITVRSGVELMVSLAGDAQRRNPFDHETIGTYSCAGRPTEYRLVHLPGQPTPLRIDLRAEGDASFTAEITLASASGRALTEASLGHDAGLSSFDWLQREGVRYRVSEASRHYLLAPPEVERLTVACATGGLVSLYNQEVDVLRIDRPGAAFEDRQRRWFPLLPTAAAELTASGRGSILKLQRRPLAAPAPSSNDARALESYGVSTESTGRHLLLPTAASAEAESWRYLPVAADERVELVFGDEGRAVTPTLLFRRQRDTPFRLRVEVDGRTILDEEWAGRQGQIRLPAIGSGAHRVRLAGDPGIRFFLSHLRDGSRSAFARRFVATLPSRPFEIRVAKSGPTVLTGRLFFVAGSGAACSLTAEIGGGSRPVGVPLPDWTYTRRRYEVAGGGERVAALGGDTLWMERSEPFFLRLGEDITNGPVPVRWTPSCRGKAYFTLSRLVEAPREERGIFFSAGSEAL